MARFNIVSNKHGKFTVLIDDDDYDRVMQYKWSIFKSKNSHYAMRVCADIQKNQFLHQFIRPAPVGMVVDHENGNTLDNSKDNLRVCTRADNCANAYYDCNGFRGVVGRKEKYSGRVKIDGKNVSVIRTCCIYTAALATSIYRLLHMPGIVSNREIEYQALIRQHQANGTLPVNSRHLTDQDGG